MPDLFARWQARQDDLAARLAEWGASGHEYRVDLANGRFWWQDEDGRVTVEADCKGILSYALSNRSVMMAWAVKSLQGGAVIGPIEGMSEYHPNCDEGTAWDLALKAADGCGCDYVYRAPSAQDWFFLALWNVRLAAGNPAPEPHGTPAEHVHRVIDGLIAKATSGGAPEELATLLRNYGQDIVESSRRTWRGSPWEAELRAVGTALQAAATLPQESRIAVLRRAKAMAVFPATQA